jgi:hypothetical protein
MKSGDNPPLFGARCAEFTQGWVDRSWFKGNSIGSFQFQGKVSNVSCSLREKESGAPRFGKEEEQTACFAARNELGLVPALGSWGRGGSDVHHGFLEAPSARAQLWSGWGPEGGLRFGRAARKTAAHCPLLSARGGAGARSLGTWSRLLAAGQHSTRPSPPGPVLRTPAARCPWGAVAAYLSESRRREVWGRFGRMDSKE